MPVFQNEDYLSKVTSFHRDYRAETLRVHRKLLFSLCNQHQLWAKQTDNPEIAARHMKAADAIQETINQYDQILERYYLHNSEVEL
jgi:hypothetical protein